VCAHVDPMGGSHYGCRPQTTLLGCFSGHHDPFLAREAGRRFSGSFDSLSIFPAPVPVLSITNFTRLLGLLWFMTGFIRYEAVDIPTQEVRESEDFGG